MGNYIRTFCCSDTSNEVGDEREEQSQIWSENASSLHHYGSCAPTSPIPPTIYKTVLPSNLQIAIEQIENCHDHVTTDDANSRLINHDSDDEQQSELDQNSRQKQEQPAVIKEEFCAEQFKQIRSLIFKNSDDDERFIKLLWSCIPWAAPGGKSGSTFLKTVNDQFILKQMSKSEFELFLSISDAYFSYINKSRNDKRPSLLTTILGIFKIVYRNSSTQSATEYYLMVMQNLFFKRNISQRFDLKGSMRNRLVDIDDIESPDHVLMDENLLRITCEQPLLISTKSKQILNDAIDSDSKFLASIAVMDYSLLVGVDKENSELVLGIIDYARPFTWDKKLECAVKSVVGNELPTVVKPELYRERFCEAMDKYFESVPDAGW